MLIRFHIENFLSFDKRQTFSLYPGKGTLKSEHKSDEIGGLSALKAGVVFGANASGKSNLVKAIDFGKQLILKGVKPGKPISYQKFRLKRSAATKNTCFEYEIQHKQANYAYGFVINEKEIVEEWLYKIDKKREQKIFERGRKGQHSFDLLPLYENNNEEEQQFLNFVAKGTPINNLFLHEIYTRRVKENVNDIEDLLTVLDWFNNALKVIRPDDKYKQGLKFELKQDDKLLSTFEKYLAHFDTGIDGVGLEKVEAENIDIPNSLIRKIKEELMSKTSENVRASMLSTKNTTYFFSVQEEQFVIEKFITKRKVEDDHTVEKFDTRDESDGTNRIMDYIPILLDLLKGENVFVVDEMERSLHPNLIYELIDLFLSNAEGVNSQLILASHEATLLTQKLFRKDEIWFVVKDEKGASSMHALEEYGIRFDKKIMKDYLLGRFSGVPRLGSRNQLYTLKN